MGQQPGFTAENALVVRRRRYSNMKGYRPPMPWRGAFPASWVQMSQATTYDAGADQSYGAGAEADDEAMGDDDASDEGDGDMGADDDSAGPGEATDDVDDDIDVESDESVEEGMPAT